MDSDRTSPKHEHLLVILPFPEMKDMTLQIRHENPVMRITWIEQKMHPLKAWRTDVDIPVDLYHDATILMTLRMIPQPEQAPNLRYVHSFAAGTEHLVTSRLFKETDVVMSTSSGSHGPQIAEWVMMTILAQSHRLRELYAFQSERKYGAFDDHFGVRDLRGQRMGVLGYGSIGRHVAQVAKAFGMDVIVYTATPKLTVESKKDRAYVEAGSGDPNGEIPSAWYSGVDKASLHDFLDQDIDVLVVAAPATPQTRRMLGKEEFEILGRKQHALISNVGRGEVIDHAALVEALKNPPEGSWLRGVALDVTDPEPLPADHELWGLPNVTITPHVSGAAIGYPVRSLDILRINIGRLKRGEALLNGVDRTRGY